MSTSAHDLGSRLIAGHLAIALVVVLSAVTALVALGSSIRRAEHATAIDDRLARIAEIRADTREMALSARRFLLSGNQQERQRVLAIDAALVAKRDALWSDVPYPAEWVEALGDYGAALAAAMERDDRDLVALAHFEADLQHARGRLDATFEPLVAAQRRALDRQRTSLAMTRGAQWTVIAASVVALCLLVAIGFAVRRVAGPEMPRASRAIERAPLVHGEPIDVLSLVDRVTSAYRSHRPYGGPRVRFEARMGLVVHGDPAVVARVLARLVALADAEAKVASEIVIYSAARLGHVRLSVRCEVAPHSALPSDAELGDARELLAANRGACGVEQRGDIRAYWLMLPAAPAA